ncbi:MAG: [LysW]-aminoadipate kinase, partial [Anaerolineae bacterium]
LKAQTLVILSNVPGLLEQFPDENTVIPHILPANAPVLLDQVAQGRMKKKVLGVVEAVNEGVQKAVIADGRVNRPLQRALAGQGTVIG